MRRRTSRLRPVRALALSAAALGLVLAACGDDGSGSNDTTTTVAPAATTAAPSTSAAPDLSGVTLTVGVETSSFGDLAVRKASGAFDGTPYTLKFAEFDSTPVAMEALYAKAIDAMMDASPQGTLIAQGNADPAWTPATAPFAVASVNVVTSRESGPKIIVRPDSGIATVKDLAGKKVAFTAGTLSHVYLMSVLGQSGIDPKTVEQVKMSSADSRAAFAAGDVDAVVTSFRQALGVLAKGNAVALPDVGEPMKSYRALLVRPEILADPAKQAAVADFILRSEQAETWIRTHPTEVAAIYADSDKLDADTAAKVAIAVQRKTVPIDATVLAAFQAQADIFLAEGVVDHAIDLSLVFDTRFNSIIPVA